MTQSITTDDVAHVAKLANLPIPTAKLQVFQSQLASILEYVQVIQSTDTKNVPETHQTTGLTNVLRADRVDNSRTFSQEEALKNAKHTHKGYIMVPAILEDE
jgi:aspartyl-tRNA(Asn)/glutamyl-tRNA(Gln) amidotransferase subunit C